jgi:hypothetical protein
MPPPGGEGSAQKTPKIIPLETQPSLASLLFLKEKRKFFSKKFIFVGLFCWHFLPFAFLNPNA